MTTDKELKTYRITRIIEEIYQVRASSKEEALKNVQDPSIITVKKETIRLDKNYK
jgi:hypothetical protein